MTSQSEDAVSAVAISIYKGGASSSTQPGANESLVASARKDIADVLNSRHLAFVLGSGCSSALDDDGVEQGIPTMVPMAAGFTAELDAGRRIAPSDVEELNQSLGINLLDHNLTSNLEHLLEVLYSFRLALPHSTRSELESVRPTLDRAIAATKQYVLDCCLAGGTGDAARTVVSTYERFYRRLAQRDRALPRPWVFTTNYDLFNETAMDRLGIPYINGFQGSVERRFNPATFRYTIAEQLDISSRRWSSLDSLVYFAKLHGSLSWQSTDEGLFPVREAPPSEHDDLDRLLIYPTPAKQNASFASPYSDMFREFQSRVAREQSALICIGYSFSDEHVNNVIFQALTIPTFRLVAFVNPDTPEIVSRLRALEDPRIWLIGTEDASLRPQYHYFRTVVDDLMASSEDDSSETAIRKVLTELIGRTPASAQPSE